MSIRKPQDGSPGVFIRGSLYSDTEKYSVKLKIFFHGTITMLLSSFGRKEVIVWFILLAF